MAGDDDGFGDGTQAAPFSDALSGQVGDPAEDFQLTRVAGPVKPDPRVVRELADDATGDMFGGPAVFPPAGPGTPPPATSAQPIAPAPPLGMLPRQRARPTFRGYRPSLRIPRISLPPTDTVRRVKPSRGSTGIIVAVLLMIAFAVLAIEFLSSLIGGITGLFS